MPIAHCTVSPSVELFDCNLSGFTRRWAELAGTNADEMTINFVQAEAQSGKPYAVVAQLILPSLWSTSSVKAIQLALSNTLSETLGVSVDHIIVVTSVIESGLVVESGKVVEW
ncbi:hypothetical protein J4N42_20330 [Vibrio sp. SCSIO 43135]|uniref:hypothetical protein n=1 Tax=Vibrio sp. SCSIO 43135 TaxID=2819096 RepID=UPI0020765837|nr:hypothetical protein [Vibrio sp. SCSIO 43135]USD42957.1 hypothetical protein J4N42_20330 [Vibrio sp. SCSIO 43135]